MQENQNCSALQAKILRFWSRTSGGNSLLISEVADTVSYSKHQKLWEQRDGRESKKFRMPRFYFLSFPIKTFISLTPDFSLKNPVIP